MPDETVVAKLARFCKRLKFHEIDEASVIKAKQLILDQLGIELACSSLPWNRGLYDYLCMLNAPGKCTVAGYGLKTNPEYAALANATFGHGFEIDDYIVKGPVGHPGCNTVPIAVALAETRPVSGKLLIEAVVAGYQVMAAIAQGIQPSSIYQRGFHEQGTCGPFASAAVAGMLLGQDETALANTFSLTASHACGIMEYTNAGGNVKRLHAGIAAVGGLRSAFLAERGWAGAPTAIEGKRGFCQAFAAEYNVDAIEQGLPQDYWVKETGIKPYNCNANIIPAIDALTLVLSEAQIPAEQLEEIKVGLSSRAGKAVGAIGPEPHDMVGSQFSIHFSLAMTLVHGVNDFDAYQRVNLKDPELVSAAKKVKLVADEEADREIAAGRLFSRVVVTTKDGRSFTKQTYAKGSPQNPLSQSEIEAKFRRLTSKVLESRKVEELIELCMNLEKVSYSSKIAECLAKAE